MISLPIAVSHRPGLIRHPCDELRRESVTEASNMRKLAAERARHRDDESGRRNVTDA
jgi:hypothetical protein